MALDVELAEIRDFLAAQAPFDTLPPSVLELIPARLAIAYRRRGTVVLPAGAKPSELLIVRSGAVEFRDAEGTLLERAEAGTCIGGGAMATDVPQPIAVTAIEDTLLLVCPADLFHDLRGRHPDFAAFFEQRAGQLSDAVARQRHQHMSDGDRAVLTSKVAHLLNRGPIAIRADASILEAARLMTEERTSSVLVTDGERLVGILTDRDLRTRVLATGLDPSARVSTVMSPNPAAIGSEALALEALLELGRRNIHHLPVVDDGRPRGVITATDLLRLQQASPVFLVGDIAKATDVAAVAELASRLQGVVGGLVRQGTSAPDAGRVVTTVGDAIEQRLIALAEEQLGPPPVPYAWVTLGSRARFEQALAPDQDHAMVLHDDYRPEQHGDWFRDLAELVTTSLETVGYPRCRGDKMSTNPQWRQPLRVWQEQVVRWIRTPTPEAVLETSVFFDLRHQHGDPSLSGELGRTQRLTAYGAPIFLAHLAAAAARHPTPLGFFRGLVVDRSGAYRDTLDVKKGGINTIVEIARLHGLACCSPATATLTRLEDAQTAGLLSAPLAADLRDAWEFLAHVRLVHQVAQVRSGKAPDNRVDPSSLSQFEKRHLKAAFGVIRFAQSAIAQRYPVREMT